MGVDLGEGRGVSQVPQCAYGNLGFFHAMDGVCPRRTLFSPPPRPPFFSFLYKMSLCLVPLQFYQLPLKTPPTSFTF